MLDRTPIYTKFGIRPEGQSCNDSTNTTQLLENQSANHQLSTIGRLVLSKKGCSQLAKCHGNL